MLIENPRIQLAAKVPSREIGIAIAGIKVRRIEPVKSRMVPITTRMDMSSVVITSRTDPRMNTESSEMICRSTPSMRALMSATASRTPSAIWMVFEPAWRIMPIPTTRSPLSRTNPVESSGEKATLATSLMRISSRIISELMSSSRVTAASARTSSCWSPVRKLPAGTSSGAARNTSVTSATVRP